VKTRIQHPVPSLFGVESITQIVGGDRRTLATDGTRIIHGWAKGTDDEEATRSGKESGTTGEMWVWWRRMWQEAVANRGFYREFTALLPPLAGSNLGFYRILPHNVFFGGQAEGESPQRRRGAESRGDANQEWQTRNEPQRYKGTEPSRARKTES
jgi:hypothetical protein